MWYEYRFWCSFLTLLRKLSLFWAIMRDIFIFSFSGNTVCQRSVSNSDPVNSKSTRGGSSFLLLLSRFFGSVFASLIHRATSHLHLTVPCPVPHGVEWQHWPCGAQGSRLFCRTEPARGGSQVHGRDGSHLTLPRIIFILSLCTWTCRCPEYMGDDWSKEKEEVRGGGMRYIYTCRCIAHDHQPQ